MKLSQIINITAEEIKAMSTEERAELKNELTIALLGEDFGDTWKTLSDIYDTLNDIDGK